MEKSLTAEKVLGNWDLSTQMNRGFIAKYKLTKGLLWYKLQIGLMKTKSGLHLKTCHSCCISTGQLEYTCWPMSIDESIMNGHGSELKFVSMEGR